MKILLVDDEKSLLVAISDELRDAGYEVTSASSGEEALPLIKETIFDLVITDLVMSNVSGIDIISAAKHRCDSTEVMVITAHATLETAITALKSGAIDYICKPFETNVLLSSVRSIREIIRLKQENKELRSILRQRHRFQSIIGKSAAMQKVFNLLEIVSATDKTVLVTGETGTGKQMIAEAIHYTGARAEKPFITVSCAALSHNVLESELFGHERGAFTGAIRDKRGRFELAHTGTLFLDDVDDIPPDTQVKFLQAIETGKFERVGGESTLSVDVRVIAATKHDLKDLVQQGKFRMDLFYRLNVIQIDIPPLRERKEDIPLLVSYFLQQCCPERSIEMSSEIMAQLLQYNWEGNVRELKHVVERLVLLSQDGYVGPDALPAEVKSPSAGVGVFEPGSVTLPDFLYEVERSALIKTMTDCGGSKTRMAEVLGIPLPTLKSKLIKFNLE